MQDSKIHTVHAICIKMISVVQGTCSWRSSRQAFWFGKIACLIHLVHMPMHQTEVCAAGDSQLALKQASKILQHTLCMRIALN